MLPFGINERPNAQCPKCLSLERHRLLWMFLGVNTDLFKKEKLRILHFAPEKCISERLKKLPNIEYVSADLDSGKADFIMDIKEIPSKNDNYDAVLCCHVLEHIPDDIKAMKELYRILKPDGWAVLQVPIGRKKTFEDRDISSWAERENIYGQGDHYRIYGLDYLDRLRDTGFNVKAVPFADELKEKLIRKFNLSTENIYFCHK